MAKQAANRTAGPSGRQKVPIPTNTSGGNYFAQVFAELKKVIWPTRDELTRMTGIVIVTVLIFSALIGGADLVLAKGAQAVYNGATATSSSSSSSAKATPTPKAKSTSKSTKSTPKPKASPTPKK